MPSPRDSPCFGNASRYTARQSVSGSHRPRIPSPLTHLGLHYRPLLGFGCPSSFDDQVLQARLLHHRRVHQAHLCYAGRLTFRTCQSPRASSHHSPSPLSQVLPYPACTPFAPRPYCLVISQPTSQSNNQVGHKSLSLYNSVPPVSHPDSASFLILSYARDSLIHPRCSSTANHRTDMFQNLAMALLWISTSSRFTRSAAWPHRSGLFPSTSPLVQYFSEAIL